MTDQVGKVEGRFEKFKRAGREIHPALIESWPYMIWGFAIAAVFFGASQLVPGEYQSTWWGKVINHLGMDLGMGFIVSTLAVFGYEWRAHLKKITDLARDLGSRIDAAKVINDGLVGSDRLLQAIEVQQELRSKAGQENLRLYLDSIFLNDKNAQHLVGLAGHCEAFVRLSLSLRNSLIERHYVDFISGIFHDLVIKPVRELVALSGGREVETDKEHHLLVSLDSAKVGDRLLEAHMNALSDGGKYLVVSDLNSWRGSNLSRFRAATEKAIKERGVEVVRIFDLVRHKPDFTIAEVEEVLESHIIDAENWRGPGDKKCYTIKILGQAECSKAIKQRPKLTADKVRHLHFGLFMYDKDDVVRVAVREFDLSDLALSRSRDLIHEDLDNFHALEKAAYEPKITGLKEKIREVYES